MAITANDQYRHPPRISIDRFGQLLRERANPAVIAERNPDEYYQAIVSYGVDPLFILAMFAKESSMGKEGVAFTSKSWGNTRAPNFGAIPTGDMPGRTGRFPTWATWMDGLRSTCARLVTSDWYYAFEQRNIGEVFRDPHYPNRNPNKPMRAPIPREENHPIEWAPAGDLNSPTGYLAFMLKFMNDHADMEGVPPVTRKPIIALAAGHHNTSRGGAVGEYERVGPLTREIARRAREHGGFDVHVITPNDGMGDFPGGLQDVAYAAVRLNANCFLEVHMEGNPAGNAGRGCFAIYPDWPPDVDLDVRDKLGIDMARKVRDATGLPLRGSGVMSERSTGVGAGGHRLGAFSASASARASMERVLFEYGALTSPLDKTIIDGPDFNARAAQATVDALAAFYNVFASDRDPQDNPIVDDPNSQAFEYQGETFHIVNTITVDGDAVAMLDFYREMGGHPRLGSPVGGMYMEIIGGKRVYKQETENVLMEAWVQGFGNIPGPYYRFGRRLPLVEAA